MFGNQLTNVNDCFSNGNDERNSTDLTYSSKKKSLSTPNENFKHRKTILSCAYENRFWESLMKISQLGFHMDGTRVRGMY